MSEVAVTFDIIIKFECYHVEFLSYRWEEEIPQVTK